MNSFIASTAFFNVVRRTLSVAFLCAAMRLHAQGANSPPQPQAAESFSEIPLILKDSAKTLSHYNQNLILKIDLPSFFDPDGYLFLQGERFSTFSEVASTISPLRSDWSAETWQNFGRQVLQKPCNLKLSFRYISDFEERIADEVCGGYMLRTFEKGSEGPLIGFGSLGKLYLRAGKAFHIDGGVQIKEPWQVAKKVGAFGGVRYSQNIFGGWMRFFVRAHCYYEDALTRLKAASDAQQWDRYPTSFIFGSGIEFHFLRLFTGRLDLLDGSIGHDQLKPAEGISAASIPSMLMSEVAKGHCWKFSLQLHLSSHPAYAVIPPNPRSIQGLKAQLRGASAESFSYLLPIARAISAE